MTIIVYNLPIEIRNDNARTFQKMHHTDIDATDVEMYLDAYYHTNPSALTKLYSPRQLSDTVNENIIQEARGCYNADF